MRRATGALAGLVCAVWFAACMAAASPPLGAQTQRTHSVAVVSNGWHAAIVIGRAELVATGLLPEADDFPDAVFLEFGWGDRVYYPAGKKTIGMALRAALTATPAVMHMAGLARPPELTYADVEVFSFALSQEEFRHLVGAIAGQFERPEGGRAAAVSRGLYPDSNFYHALGTFSLFNTCNTWAARMLRAGGVNVSPSGIVTADELVTRLRPVIDQE